MAFAGDDPGKPRHARRIPLLCRDAYGADGFGIHHNVHQLTELIQLEPALRIVQQGNRLPPGVGVLRSGQPHYPGKVVSGVQRPAVALHRCAEEPLPAAHDDGKPGPVDVGRDVQRFGQGPEGLQPAARIDDDGRLEVGREGFTKAVHGIGFGRGQVALGVMRGHIVDVRPQAGGV